MSLELIMNADGAIDHAAGSLVSGGTFTITSTPDTYSKVDSSGIHVGPLLFSFVGGNASGMVDGSVNIPVGSIPATATLDKAGGISVMRLGDSAEITFISTVDSSPPVPGTVIGSVEVSNAGQTSTKGQ
jgi:hypothetical protein